MHSAPFLFVAAIGIPSAQQWLTVVVPFLVIAGFWWFVNRLDQIIDRLFPHWAWERKLGWLNIGAERQANAVLRWIGYGFYSLLVVTLYGIVWGAEALPLLAQWSDLYAFGELAYHLPVLFFCLSFWLFYLGCGLLPRLRDQYEEEELEKYRAENPLDDRDHPRPQHRSPSLTPPGRPQPTRPDRRR